MDDAAISLLKKMLEPDPEKRYSAAECLEHEFFKSSDSDNLELNTTDSDRDMMDEFSSPAERSKLKDK